MLGPVDPRARVIQDTPRAGQELIPHSASATHELRLGDAAELSDTTLEKIGNLGLHDSTLDPTKTCSARNSHALINLLPAEILGEIFHLVLCSKPCRIGGWNTVDKPIDFPKYPDLLAHVCAHWREVAISLQSLWSHIDLAPFDCVRVGLVARACVFVDRAGNAPLHVHLTYASSSTEHSAHPRWRDRDILEPVRHRIRSMEMSVESPTDEESIDSPGSLRCLLAIDATMAYVCVCVPGVLAQFTLSFNWHGTPRQVLFGLVDSDWANPAPVNGQQGVLYGLTVLRLEEAWLFPLPRSYQNLLELHIISTHDAVLPVPEIELVNALRSCPGLKIFRFNHPIIDQLDADEVVTPIRFDNLELLILEPPSEYLDSLVRWIVPGPGPLRLSICTPSQTNPALRSFLQRSHITHLRLRSIGSVQLHHNTIKLLSYTAHLRSLSIHGSFALGSNGGSPEIQLDTLYLLSLDVREIGLLKLGIRADKIVVWSCSSAQPAIEDGNTQDTIQRYLFQFSSKIEFAQGEYPLRDWD